MGPPPNIVCLHIYPGNAIYVAVLILYLWGSVLSVKPDSFASNGGGCHQLTVLVQHTWCLCGMLDSPKHWASSDLVM